MAKGRPTRRELKQADEFLTLSAKAYAYFQAHQVLLSVVVAAALALGGSLFGYFSYRSGKHGRAAEEMGRLLSGPHDPAPFLKFLEAYGDTPSAPVAWLNLGHTQYSKGDYAASLESYDRAASSARSSAYLRQQALLGKAYSLVALKQCDKAETSFRQFIELPSPLPKDDAFLATGRCQEAVENWRAALERYEEFLAKYPSSPFITEGFQAKVEGLRRKVGGGK